jgi:hypothetical protein
MIEDGRSIQCLVSPKASQQSCQIIDNDSFNISMASIIDLDKSVRHGKNYITYIVSFKNARNSTEFISLLVTVS